MSARFHFSSCTFFANNFAHSIFAMLAIGSSPVITVYLARVKRKNADNRTLPFPVNGSPSARFRKRNVTDVGKPTRTRPEARGANNRTLFRSPLLFLLLFLAYNLTYSDYVLLAIADGVANSRFIGCLVALFFLQVLPHATMRLPILKQMRTTGRCRFP